MNDAFLMRRFERFTDMPSNIESFFNGNGTALNAFSKCLAFYKLEHQEPHIVSFLEIVDRSNVGMIERCKDFRFSLEPADTRRIT